MRKVSQPRLNILDLINSKHYDLSTSYLKTDLKRHHEVRVDKKYIIIPPNPATGMFFWSLDFIFSHWHAWKGLYDFHD